jgi:hypothetical protein
MALVSRSSVSFLVLVSSGEECRKSLTMVDEGLQERKEPHLVRNTSRLHFKDHATEAHQKCVTIGRAVPFYVQNVFVETLFIYGDKIGSGVIRVRQVWKVASPDKGHLGVCQFLDQGNIQPR